MHSTLPCYELGNFNNHTCCSYLVIRASCHLVDWGQVVVLEPPPLIYPNIC